MKMQQMLREISSSHAPPSNEKAMTSLAQGIVFWTPPQAALADALAFVGIVIFHDAALLLVILVLEG